MKKVFNLIDKIFEYTIALIFILMVIAGGMQVFNRFFLNQSLSWSEEFQKFAHIWLIFFAIPVAYHRGSHIGMKVLFNKFPVKIQKLLDISFDIMWMILAVAISYYTTIIMGITKNQYSAGLHVRMDMVYIGMLIGGLYLFIISLRKIVEKFSPAELIIKEGEAC